MARLQPKSSRFRSRSKAVSPSTKKKREPQRVFGSASQPSRAASNVSGSAPR